MALFGSKELDSLKAEYEGLKAKYEEDSSKLEAYANKIATLEASLNESTAKAESLEAENKNLLDVKASLESFKKESEQKFSDLQASIDAKVKEATARAEVEVYSSLGQVDPVPKDPQAGAKKTMGLDAFKNLNDVAKAEFFRNGGTLED